ncbi:hypothetical protein V8E54_012991 [Elaphomyces granulatus]
MVWRFVFDLQFIVGYYGDHSLHPNPADDVFVNEVAIEEDSLLQSAFPGIDTENPVEVVSDLDRPNCYYNVLLGGGVDYKPGPTALDFLFDDCDGTRIVLGALGLMRNSSRGKPLVNHHRSSSTLSSTSLSSSVSPKPPADSESSVSSVSSSYGLGQPPNQGNSRSRDAFLGATVGETVDAVYSIGSNMLTGACLRGCPGVPPVGKLEPPFFAGEDLGRDRRNGLFDGTLGLGR